MGGLVLLCGLTLAPSDALGQGAAGVAPVSPLRSRPEPERPRVMREGSFLIDMRGRLRRMEAGSAIDFAPDLSGEQVPSMMLLASMTRSAMEQVVGPRSESTDLIVSGQVFVYRGRNYLLPTRFEIAGADSSGDSAPPSAGGPNPAADPADLDENDPSIESIARRVEEGTASRPDLPASPQSRGTGAATLREGEVISLRRGRVARSADGGLEFTTDNDPASPVAATPLKILPTLNLERLEALVAESDQPLVVSLSGRVFVYGQSNYILPTMYIVEADRSGNLTSGQ